VYFVFIEYSQKSLLSPPLRFVDIRHDLHKVEKEFDIVRQRCVVIAIVEELSENGM
jgi:hypothetical protein